MSDHTFNETVESLFKGMDNFLTTKTVVGEAIHVNDTLILPLVDVSFGVGAGAWSQEHKNSAGGGMGGKMTPSAVLVIKDGSVRMVPVNNNDPVSKIIDMAPDVIHRFMNKSEDDAAVESAVEHISEEEKRVRQTERALSCLTEEQNRLKSIE